jgi:hypothetical protein
MTSTNRALFAGAFDAALAGSAGEDTVANSALGIKPKTDDCIKDGSDQRQAGMDARENSTSKRRSASEKRSAERMIANGT